MPMPPQTMYGADVFHVDVKPGVKFDVLAPGGVKLLWALQEVARVLRVNLLLTAGTNGHKAPSRHVTGDAVDVSVSGLPVEMILSVRSSLMALLGSAFYVSYECPSTPADARLAAVAAVNSGATAPHFHLQVRKGTVWPQRSGSLVLNAAAERDVCPAPSE